MTRIYEDDRVPFLIGFTKQNIIKQLDEHGSFSATYRLIDTGKPIYVNMKITRMYPDTKHMIIGISVIDPVIKEQEKKRLKVREEVAYSRIMALSGGYFGIYNVNPETNKYSVYNASSLVKEFKFDNKGTDFFTDGIENGKKIVYEDDLELYLDNFKKEKILQQIKENGSFMLNYRILVNNNIVPVLLKIVLVDEGESERLIVGVRQWKERK